MSEESLPARTERIEIPPRIENREGVVKHLAIAHSFSGPLPPPELLGKYESLCPGSADRIIALAEREAEHRRSIEQAAVRCEAEQDKRDSDEARRGQICALMITLAAIGAGAYTALHGYEIAGSILGVGGIGSIVTSFLAGRSRQQQDLPQPKTNDSSKPKRKKQQRS